MIKLKDLLNHINEDITYLPPKYSSPEVKNMIDNDIKKMSKILGKASHQVIKVMKKMATIGDNQNETDSAYSRSGRSNYKKMCKLLCNAIVLK